MSNQLKHGPNKGEGGAPRKFIDVEVMRRAASIGCNGEEIAALLGISRSAFYNHLNEDEGLQDMLDEARERGRATLRRMQWQRANDGSDTMLIWLGKNMLGQRDTPQIVVTNQQLNMVSTDPAEASQIYQKVISSGD